MGLFSAIGDAFKGAIGGQSLQDKIKWEVSNGTAWGKEYLRRQALAQDANRIQQYASNIYGTEAQPQQVEMQRQIEEGPMQPGVERQMQTVSQITQPGQQATGLFKALQGRPIQTALMKQNKAMVESGIPALMKVGLENVQNMANEYMKVRNERAITPTELFMQNPEQYAKMKQLGFNPNAGVNVNNYPAKLRSVDQELDYKEQVSRGEDAINYNKAIVSSGNTSSDRLQKVNKMVDLINQGANTGFGEDWAVKGKQILKSMGYDVPSLAGQEQLQVLMGDLVMERVGETKGAVSEKEMDLFREYSANMSKSKEGNLAILDFTKQKLERDKKLRDIVRKMQRKGARSAEIRVTIEDYIDRNPIKPYATQEDDFSKLDPSYEYKRDASGKLLRRKK